MVRNSTFTSDYFPDEAQPMVIPVLKIKVSLLLLFYLLSIRFYSQGIPLPGSFRINMEHMPMEKKDSFYYEKGKYYYALG